MQKVKGAGADFQQLQANKSQLSHQTGPFLTSVFAKVPTTTTTITAAAAPSTNSTTKEVFKIPGQAASLPVHSPQALHD